MKKWLSITLFTLLILALVACTQSEETSQTGGQTEASSDEITVSHELGEAVVPVNPENVVVFDYGVLDTLDALGIEVAGLPKSTIPSYLEKYEGEEYTNLGSLKEADFEAIAALNPDVIFISARQSTMYEEFAEIAPTVYMNIDYTDYMNSFESNMKLLGQIFDKEAEIEAHLDELNNEIAELKMEAEALDEKALVLLGNVGEISAYGPSSRFGIIYDVFGFQPADENIEVSTHGQVVSYEYIVEQNSDILFVIDRDLAIDPEATGMKEEFENELVQKTNAYENGKIYYLSPDIWYLSGGGLQSVQQMLEDVKEGI